MLKELEQGALDSINVAKKELDTLAANLNKLGDLLDTEDLVIDVLSIIVTLQEAVTIQAKAKV